MTIRNAVLLVGSAKVEGTSTSEQLGRYIMGGLADRGVSTTVRHVPRSPAAERDRSWESDLLGSDLLVLATPLYIDSLPYLVTRTLEQLAAAPGRLSTGAFAAVINCGFPEARHCDTAMLIAKNFARRAHLTWLGGLAIGGGGAVAGQRLDDRGQMFRHLLSGLDEATEALAESRPISQETAAKVARPLMPLRLYTAMASLGWYQLAARNGVLRRLGDRPFDVPSRFIK